MFEIMHKNAQTRAYPLCYVTRSLHQNLCRQPLLLSLSSSSTKQVFASRRMKSRYARGDDETSISSAKHKPRLSGPSIGHLITELSTTTPQMLKEGLRIKGHMIEEGDRRAIRRLAYGTVAFGALFVGTVIVFGGGRRHDDG